MLSDYRKQRQFRQLERFLCRVLELDEVLRKDAIFDEERARDIKEQIRRTQKKLDALYDALDEQSEKT